MIHVRFPSQIYCNFCLRKISSIGRSKIERSPKVREALVMAEDNGLCLSMTRVLRSQSMRTVPTCTENCYCPIYCNPFVMSWREAHLCSPKHRLWLLWLFFVNELVWLFCCCSTTFPCGSGLLARKAQSTVCPHIPLPCIVGQSLA
mgnify:CR=1 FL=1